MPADGPAEPSSAALSVLRRVPASILRAAYGPDATEADQHALQAALRRLAAEEALLNATTEDPSGLSEAPFSAPPAGSIVATTDARSAPPALAAPGAGVAAAHARSRSVFGRSRAVRLRRITVAALAGVVVAGVVVLQTTSRPHVVSGVLRSSEPPRAVSTPIPLHGDPENRQRQQYALRHLFDGTGEEDLRVYLRVHGFSGALETTPVVGVVNGRARGAQAFDLGTLASGTAQGTITVLLTCDRTSTYSWTLISPGPEHDDPTSVHAAGRDCSGHVVAGSVRAHGGWLPTRLEVRVPAGIRTIVTVVKNAPRVPATPAGGAG